MMGRSRLAFTFTELLIGVVVGAIILLSLAAIGQMSWGTYGDLRRKSGVYNDIQFVQDLITGSVRVAINPLGITSGCLQVDTAYFHISGADFVYGASCGGVTSPIISGVTGLALDLTGSTASQAHVQISGAKDGVVFAKDFYASRRCP